MRLALCDEQWLFASVLAAAFDRQGHEVLITTEQPEELLAAAIRFHPDLCVLDVVDDRPATIERLRASFCWPTRRTNGRGMSTTTALRTEW